MYHLHTIAAALTEPVSALPTAPVVDDGVRDDTLEANRRLVAHLSAPARTDGSRPNARPDARPTSRPTTRPAHA